MIRAKNPDSCQKSDKHPLLAFSGILNDKEAEGMLKAIADRHNKDADFTL